MPFQTRVALKIGYDEELAYQIEAGSDFFLMPSRCRALWFKPNIFIALWNFAIVHSVGGLKDTVVDLGADQKTEQDSVSFV